MKSVMKTYGRSGDKIVFQDFDSLLQDDAPARVVPKANSSWGRKPVAEPPAKLARSVSARPAASTFGKSVEKAESFAAAREQNLGRESAVKTRENELDSDVLLTNQLEDKEDFDCLLYKKQTSIHRPRLADDVNGGDFESGESEECSDPFAFGENHVISTKCNSPRRSIAGITSLAASSAEKPFLVRSSSSGSPQKPALLKASSWPRNHHQMNGSINKLHCKRSEKKLFTVIQDVHVAHEVQEQGRNQMFLDDLQYSLDGLDAERTVALRCLSACSLASQCASPSFRQSLRACNATNQLFCRLSDAPQDQRLALCTATLLFMLSRDRLNMDLDQKSLELLVQLLWTKKMTETEHSDDKTQQEVQKWKDKVRNLLVSADVHGLHHINLKDISASQLACEALLSLMSSLVGADFRDDLRLYGGLDRLIELVLASSAELPDLGGDRHCVCLTGDMVSRFDRVSRPLQILADSTLKDRSAQAYLFADNSRQNMDNQHYLVNYNRGVILSALTRVLRMCSHALIPENLQQISISDWCSCGYGTVFVCLQQALRLLVSLTHGQVESCVAISGCGNLLEPGLHSILQMPRFLPEEKRIAVLLQALPLLLNLATGSGEMRKQLASLQPSWLDSHSVIVALVTLCEEHQAVAASYDLDQILDNRLAVMQAAATVPALTDSQEASESSQPIAQSEDGASAREQAQRHMQPSLVAAYIAMLLGLMAEESAASKLVLRSALTDRSIQKLLELLTMFISFLRLADMASDHEMQCITNVIDLLRGFSRTTSDTPDHLAICSP